MSVEDEPGVAEDWRERPSFTRLHFIAYVLVELLMKVVCVAGYVASFEYHTGTPLAESILRALVTAIGTVSAGALLEYQLVLPIERARAAIREGAVTDEALADASRRLHRLPRQIALLRSAAWVTYFAILFATSSRPASPGPTALFLATMLTGPALTGHSLTAFLAAPLVRRLSLLVRHRGLAIAEPAPSLRTWLIFYSVCLVSAPATYISAIALTSREQMLPAGSLYSSLGVFLFAIAVFAVMSAVILGAALTEPLAAMVSVMRRIIRRGSVARAGRVPRNRGDELGAMSDVTNEMLDRLEAVEEERRVADASLAALNHTLERRVEERTLALQQRTSEMRLVLDNVAEGLFLVDATGAMAPAHSAQLERWFGLPVPREHFCDYLGHTAPGFAARTRLGWTQVTADVFPIEVALDQLPKQLRVAGRELELAYRPLGESVAAGALVVISDITSRVAREDAERDRREAFALFERIAADRAGFLSFLEESAKYVRVIAETGARDRAELARALHTLKGNAMLFGLDRIASLCHALESELAETAAPPRADGLADLRARWTALVATVDHWFGERRGVIELEPTQLAALERAAGTGASRDTLLEMLRQLKLEPVARRLEHFADQARRIAERLDKELDVEIAEDGLRLDAHAWAEVWAALVHALRNAVDHGIEPPDERVAAGKPPRGRLCLRARREGLDAVLEIEDDGRGIAWERVRERAIALGLPHATQADLIAAIFADGLSTADAVTDLSGRGVGLGALRHEVLALGGTIDLASTPGRGTRLRLTIPASPVTSDGAPAPAASSVVLS